MARNLRSLHTFGLAASANRICVLEKMSTLEAELEESSFSADTDLILGGGSNLVFLDDFPATVYLNRLPGRQLIEDDGARVRIRLAAGENWHQAVRWTLEQGWYGLENLSLIPGLCGAAPMQNIGAYGVELSEVLTCVHALDLRTGEHREIPNGECAFAYRDSRFKSGDRGRFLITAIELELSHQPGFRLDYPGVRESLASMGIQQPNGLQLSDAIIRLRQSKLPDPDETGNCGSFFKNPVISRTRYQELQSLWPALPAYPLADGIKLSAAWLIEEAGLKGCRVGGAAVSRKHALVLINTGDATGADLKSLVQIIQRTINEQYGIALEPEPLLIEHHTRPLDHNSLLS